MFTVRIYSHGTYAEDEGPYTRQEARERLEELNRRPGIRATMHRRRRPTRPPHDRSARVFGVAMAVSVAIAVWAIFAILGGV